MLPHKPVTRRSALFILMLLATAASIGGYSGRKPHVTGIVKDAKSGDVDMYRAVVERVNVGEGYYSALGDELRSRGYPTKPFFHWRLPTLLWSLGQLPDCRIGQVVLLLLVVIMVASWLIPLKATLGFPITCPVSLILGAPMLSLACMTWWYFEHTLWSGVLVALSLGIYRRSVTASVICGLAALAIRQLALLYVIIMLASAIFERKAKEAVAWAAGIVGFGLFLAIHVATVSRYTEASEPSGANWTSGVS